MSAIGDRLREERIRLSLNQEDFSKLGGVKRNSQVKYEKGERHPDSEYFSAIADKVDILYIVTGRKSMPEGVKENPEKYNLYQKPEDALMPILAIQDELGLSFTADQLKALLGFTYQYQANEKDIKAFVELAFQVAGNPLEKD